MSQARDQKGCRSHYDPTRGLPFRQLAEKLHVCRLHSTCLQNRPKTIYRRMIRIDLDSTCPYLPTTLADGTFRV